MTFGRFYRLIAILAACLVLAGCGFQPLYATRMDGSSASLDLSIVAVAEQPTRLGQLIRNELLSIIGPEGQDGAKLHLLQLSPVAEEEVVIQDFDTGVLRRSFRIEAAFRLTRIGSETELFSGELFTQASYDRTGTPFANRQARIAAEERAAKELGTDIATRLAAYFASR